MSSAAKANGSLTLQDIEVPEVVPLNTPSTPIPTLINTESGLRLRPGGR